MLDARAIIQPLDPAFLGAFCHKPADLILKGWVERLDNHLSLDAIYFVFQEYRVDGGAQKILIVPNLMIIIMILSESLSLSDVRRP
jgi:hypothetical protein